MQAYKINVLPAEVYPAALVEVMGRTWSDSYRMNGHDIAPSVKNASAEITVSTVLGIESLCQATSV